MEIKDSVGNILNDGDTIVLTKTLKIKGMSKTLKRGDKIKNIKKNIQSRFFNNISHPFSISSLEIVNGGVILTEESLNKK